MKHTIESVREMLGKISRWPWETAGLKSRIVGHPDSVAVMKKDQLIDWICHMQVSGCPNFREDATFIAAAPQIVSDLIEEVERLREALRRISQFWMDNDGNIGGRAKELAQEALEFK